MIVHRCGTCHFGEIIGQDLTKRLCHGAPPSATQVMLPNRTVTIQSTRPIVSVTDLACGHYRDKNVGDLQRDANSIKAMQVPDGQGGGASETKQ